MKNQKSIIIVIAVLVVSVLGIFLRNRNDAQFDSPFVGNTVFEIGKEAPDFELTDFEGNSVKLSDFRGKPVMIDFWTRWCPFCREEMPEINSVFNELNGELVVLGIHRTATEPLAVGIDFAQELGIDYILLQGNSDEVYEIYGNGLTVMPIAVYVDSEGIVVASKAGPKTAAEIKEALEEITARSNE